MITYLKKFHQYFKQYPLDKHGYFWNKYPPKLKISLLDIIINVSHNKQFAYFRVFKAANSTVVASLYHAETEIAVDSLNKLQDVKDHYYFRPSTLSKKQVVSLMNHYYKFTFVRNPYVRVLAAYLDKVKNNHAGKQDMIATHLGKQKGSMVSFDEFLAYLETGGIEQNAHWARQSDLLPIPIESFDFIGRTENLASDLQIVLKHIFNKECPIISVKEHATNARRQMNNFSGNEVNRIYKLYQADFELFNYQKDFNK